MTILPLKIEYITNIEIFVGLYTEQVCISTNNKPIVQIAFKNCIYSTGRVLTVKPSKAGEIFP